MPTRDADMAADEDFGRLLLSSRFKRLVGGPPPRRAPTPERDVPRRVGAALVLVAMVPVGLVAGLFCVSILVFVVSAVAAGQVQRDSGGAVCALVVCGVVAASCWFACRAAWRSLWPPSRRSNPRADPFLARKAARVLSAERRGSRQGEVELEYPDGVRVIHPARNGLILTLVVGDMGVAHLVESSGRLVDFTVLFQRAEPPGGERA